MASAKLLNLFAVLSLAILACSFGSSPANALIVESPHNVMARSVNHASVVKKRRGTNCIPRPVSSASHTSTHTSSTKPVIISTPAKPPPPPPSSTTHPAAIPTNQAATSPRAKVGIAWANPDEANLANFKTNLVTHVMTWSPWIPEPARKFGYKPAPMLWGPKQIESFKQLVVAGYADVALGFNEPNQQGQSDLSPEYAAQLWKQHIQPLSQKGYTLVTPATTNAPTWKTWFDRFFAACTGCTFRAIAVHFYGTKPEDLITFLNEVHDRYKMKIWLTEFACMQFGAYHPITDSDVWHFMVTAKNFMNNADFVEKYFAFGVLHDMGNVDYKNQLMKPDGHPTALGAYYINN